MGFFYDYATQYYNKINSTATATATATEIKKC
jgi:hypothetical protein